MRKVVLIDNKLLDRQALEKLINDYCLDMKVVGFAADISTAIKIIKVLEPNLVFFDLDLPQGLGFDFAEHFDAVNFDIVCTSNNEKHAVAAFRMSAVDFLLKPILPIALKKVDAKIEKRENRSEETVLTENESLNPVNTKQRIVFPSSDGLLYFHPDEVLYLNSEGRHTRIFLTNGNSSISIRSLKDCLASINLPTFVRVHRSFAINLSHIRHYSKGKDSFILMEKGIRIEVGKNFKDELSEIVSFFTK